jgi:hypothetical protein
MQDLTCVLHLHSTYSDGTGTVAEIAAAARRARADVVLLTDHDTMAARDAGEERWWGPVLVLVGEEVSPVGGDHYLAFGIDRPIRHGGLDCAGIVAAVREAGGFGFGAHPFSVGSPLLARAVPMPWADLECLDGVELWSMVNDAGSFVHRWRDAARLVLTPGGLLERPPERNISEWDRLCRRKRVVAVAGVDAHQFGRRIAGRVVRLMGYQRSFRYLRTHVLLERPLTGELGHDREAVFGALREGRCYLAMDAPAPATGFRLWADGPQGELPMGGEAPAGEWTLHARLPRPATLRLIRDGELVAERHTAGLEHRVEESGVWRVEACLPPRRGSGRERTWIISNPVYLR